MYNKQAGNSEEEFHLAKIEGRGRKYAAIGRKEQIFLPSIFVKRKKGSRLSVPTILLSFGRRVINLS